MNLEKNHSFYGPRGNKFHILVVEPPVCHGAQAQEYRDISTPGQHRQTGCICA
jgi:hypothetical protein